MKRRSHARKGLFSFFLLQKQDRLYRLNSRFTEALPAAQPLSSFTDSIPLVTDYISACIEAIPPKTKAIPL